MESQPCRSHFKPWRWYTCGFMYLCKHHLQKLSSSYKMGIIILNYYWQILFCVSFMLSLFFNNFFLAGSIEIQITLKIISTRVKWLLDYFCRPLTTELWTQRYCSQLWSVALFILLLKRVRNNMWFRNKKVHSYLKNCLQLHQSISFSFTLWHVLLSVFMLPS